MHWSCFGIFALAGLFYFGCLVAGFAMGHMVGYGRALAESSARYNELLREPDQYERERLAAFEKGTL